MITYPLVREVVTYANNRWPNYDKAYRAGQSGGAVFLVAAPLVITASTVGLFYASTITNPPIEIAVLTAPLLLALDFTHSGFKAVNNIIMGQYKQRKMARNLLRDRTLSPEWKNRVKTIARISKQIDMRERKYGQYDELKKARRELDTALDGIIKHNMLFHAEHAQIVQREVDTILAAYRQL